MRRLKRRIEQQEQRLKADRKRLAAEGRRAQRHLEGWLGSPVGLGLGVGAGLALGLGRPLWRRSEARSLVGLLLPFARSFLGGLKAAQAAQSAEPPAAIPPEAGVVAARPR